MNVYVSRKSVLETAASLIACGIDPKRSIIYRQSEVRIRAMLRACIALSRFSCTIIRN